jgi:Zn-dependent protease
MNMSRHELSLGRILGIPIAVDYSWFLIFGLLTWSLAIGYYPAEFKNWSHTEDWIMGAVTSAALFVSVLLHELGHSIVAIRFKIPVKRITLFIFGGVSQIGAESPRPSVEFAVAIAGPLVSFVLAAILWLLQPIVAAVAPLLALAKYLSLINGLLGLFNLIPGFPLDGGRVFRAIVWSVTHDLRRSTLLAANVGRFIAFLFIALGVWQVFEGRLVNGLWIGFIGWFLESAAVGQVQQQVVADLLLGHKVREAMVTDYLSVSPTATLQNLVEQHVLAAGKRTFVVAANGDNLGILTLSNIKEIPRAEWPTTKAFQAMIPMNQIQSVGPDTELSSVIQKLDRNGVNQLPVLRNGLFVGILSRDSFIDYLRVLREVRG